MAYDHLTDADRAFIRDAYLSAPPAMRAFHERKLAARQARLEEKRSADWCAAMRGWGVSLHPAGPKFAVECRSCTVTFTVRVPRIDEPVVVCPHCSTTNRLPLVVSSITAPARS